MSERRTLQTRGEVIEEYSRDFPAEIVETYSRPLPGAVEPVPTEPTPRSRRKKRRVWKGLLILLAIAAVIALLAAGVRWLIWELQMPDDWGEDDYYYYDQDQEDEDAPITIPTVEPDADARLELAKDRGRALAAQEVYRKVSGAVVTVAVDLDGGRMSVGTGVIFREDGYILTNHHVVAGGKSCTVLLAGGRPYAAKYIASDAGYDLAVLKINAEEALPFAEFGNSDALSVGDPVYAIGTPLDIEMGGTFTDGIVSSVNREIQLTSRTSMPLIQTNAALNNSLVKLCSIHIILLNCLCNISFYLFLILNSWHKLFNDISIWCKYHKCNTIYSFNTSSKDREISTTVNLKVNLNTF